MASAAQAAPAAPQDTQQRPTPRELTAYLPADTPLVVDLHDGEACVRALWSLAEPLPRGLPQPAAAVMRALPLLVKGKTGMTPEDLLTVFAPGQVIAAYFPAGPDGQEPFPVVMSRVDDPEEIRRVVKRLGVKLPIHIQDRILTLSNTRRNLERALRFRREGKASLLQDRRYIEGRAELKPGRSVRFYLNLDYVRRIRQRGFFEALPSPVRLLAGPLAHVLDTASRLDGRLDFLPDGVALSGHVDASPSGGAKDGPPVASLLRHGTNERRVPPAPEGTVASLYLDRDLEAFFKNADRLLDEDAATNVKKFLTGANQVLGSLDFTEGLLPALELPGAIFVTDTAPEYGEAQPRVKLPAFTLVARMTGHEERAAKRALVRALGAIGFIATNARLQNKQYPVQLRMRTQTRDRYQLQYLTYGDWDGPGRPPTDLNFGITLLFAHGHLILSSTRDGAVRAATAINALPAESAGRAVRGDYLRVTGAGVARYFHENLGILALDRVLKEGGTLQQANQFWDGAIAVLGALEAEVNVAPGQGDTGFRLSLRRVSR